MTGAEQTPEAAVEMTPTHKETTNGINTAEIDEIAERETAEVQDVIATTAHAAIVLAHASATDTFDNDTTITPVESAYEPPSEAADNVLSHANSAEAMETEATPSKGTAVGTTAPEDAAFPTAGAEKAEHAVEISVELPAAYEPVKETEVAVAVEADLNRLPSRSLNRQNQSMTH